MVELINPVPDPEKAGWRHEVTTSPDGRITKLVAHQARLGVDVTYG